MSGIINKEIKLFGIKISLLGPDDGLTAASSSSSVPGSVYADESSSSTGLTTKCSTICLKEAEQDKARKQVTENVRDGDSNTSDESTNSEFQKPQISPDLNEEPKAVPETSSSSSSPKSSTTVASQDKTALKKPDKILPCPRCNSKDTKFCYYNNYNVNQPRHYCKKCQRYWTAGGTTRDIPVGAGRRKNKSSSSNRHLLINSTNPATILSFGSSSPPSTQIPPNGFYSMDHNLTGNLNLSNQIKGFLPPQVTFPPQLSWPYLSPVQFYAAPPAYYSCKIPILPLQDSTSLGKHSRDGDTIKTARECKDSERKDSSCKSLRINDDEQNKTTDSSIWSTIGREAEKTTDGIRKRGFFQGFELKGVNLNHDAENSSALEANPAAFSRSLKFRECNNRT